MNIARSSFTAPKCPVSGTSLVGGVLPRDFLRSVLLCQKRVLKLRVIFTGKARLLFCWSCRFWVVLDEADSAAEFCIRDLGCFFFCLGVFVQLCTICSPVHSHAHRTKKSLCGDAFYCHCPRSTHHRIICDPGITFIEREGERERERETVS